MKGLKIDYDKLTAGIINLIDKICEQDESYAGALSLGMLPAPLMDLLEKHFIQKVYELFAVQQGFTVEQGNATFKEIFGTEEYYKIDQSAVSEFMHNMTVRIMAHYKKKGVIIV